MGDLEGWKRRRLPQERHGDDRTAAPMDHIKPARSELDQGLEVEHVGIGNVPWSPVRKVEGRGRGLNGILQGSTRFRRVRGGACAAETRIKKS